MWWAYTKKEKKQKSFSVLAIKIKDTEHKTLFNEYGKI